MLRKLNISTFNIVLLVCFIIYSFYSLFNRALFNGGHISYEKPLYTMLVFISIIGILLSAHLFNKKSVFEWPVMLIVWLLPLCFLIAYFFSTSHSQALNSVLIHITYAILFTLGLVLSRERSTAIATQYILLFISYVVVIFGLMNWLGDATLGGLFHYQDNARVYRDAVLPDVNGGRLTSVFQYANSYAGYLIAVLIATLFVASHSTKGYLRYIAAFMLVPIMISFLLTLSRGGLVVLPIVFILVLLLFKPVQQIMISMNALIGLITTVFILDPISDLGDELQRNFNTTGYIKGIVLIVTLSFMVCAFSWLLFKYLRPFLTKYLNKINDLRFSSAYLPSLVILVGIIVAYLLLATNLVKLLPDQIEHRISAINFEQHSVLERGYFYKDAFNIFKDYPIFGAGGGGWANLYPEYQSYSYTSREAHNFFMQYLVEIGLLGTTCLTVLILSALWFYIRYHRSQQSDHDRYPHIIFFIFVAAIVSHSFIDFNLSFVYLGSLLFFCIGAISSVASFNRISDLSRYKLYFGISFVIICIIALIWSMVLLHSHNRYSLAISRLNSQQSTFDQIILPIEQASQSTKNPIYLATQLSLYQQAYTALNDEQYLTRAIDTIKSLERFDPLNRQGIFTTTRFYSDTGQYISGIEYIENKLDSFQWDIHMYEQAIHLNTQAYLSTNSKSYRDRVFQINDEIQQRMLLLDKLPNAIEYNKPFFITPNIAISISQIYYKDSEYNKSLDYLSPFVSSDFTTKESVILYRLYLASQIMLGQLDSEEYNNFVVRFPDEANFIEQMTTQNQ